MVDRVVDAGCEVGAGAGGGFHSVTMIPTARGKTKKNPKRYAAKNLGSPIARATIVSRPPGNQSTDQLIHRSTDQPINYSCIFLPASWGGGLIMPVRQKMIHTIAASAA